MKEILPGTKVMVFDSSLYVDDLSTPLSITMKEAIVTCRYGFKSEKYGFKYPDCIDVVFNHSGRISKGHFTQAAESI